MGSRRAKPSFLHDLKALPRSASQLEKTNHGARKHEHLAQARLRRPKTATLKLKIPRMTRREEPPQKTRQKIKNH